METLIERIRAFNQERDWEKFHSPKNLAAGLAVEVAELLEIFLWLNEDQSRELDAARRNQLCDEIGDVQIYLLNLADKFQLDPLECAARKLDINRSKYPVDRVKGSARKYTEY